MTTKEKAIDKAFWKGVPNRTTWEELNKGITVTFIVNDKEYKIKTRLGNFYQMNIEEYKDNLIQRAINVVKEGAK